MHNELKVCEEVREEEMNAMLKENVNKGFSLVELIVVIAIMAVMAAVLAPALIAYVERSRAQKDDSAMGEVSNAIMLAMSDQEVFDEVLAYTCANNVSCYIDKNSEKDYDDAKYKTETKAGVDGKATQYMFNDKTRLADEKLYSFAGNMRGVTLTFGPNVKSSKKSKFDLKDGQVNVAVRTAEKFSNIANDREGGMAEWINGGEPGVASKTAVNTLGTMNAEYSTGADADHYLYNKVRAAIGDSVELSSQTYRNSDYTVFIRMGSTGGNQASAQDAIAVYGQWSGTNLPKKINN